MGFKHLILVLSILLFILPFLFLISVLMEIRIEGIRNEPSNPSLRKDARSELIDAVVDYDGNLVILEQIEYYYVKLDQIWHGHIIMYLKKINENGLKIWDKTIGYGHQGVSIRVDLGYNIFIVGNSGGKGDKFQDTPVDLVIEENNNPFIIKISADGELLWFRSYQSRQFVDLVMDRDNTLFVLGKNRTTDDILVDRISSNGTLEWSKTFLGNDVEIPTSIAVTNNSILVAGSTKSTDFLLDNKSRNTYDIFLLNLMFNGSLNWVSVLEVDKKDFVSDIQVDSDNNIVLAGYADSVVTSDTQSGVPTIYVGAYYELFIAKFDDNGEMQWLKEIEGDNHKEMKISITKNNELFVVGLTKSIDFPGNMKSIKDNGSWMIFVSLINSSGYFVHSTLFDTFENDRDIIVVSGIDNTVWIVENRRLMKYTSDSIKTIAGYP